ncbi:hypothetical protein EXIGLDRAFT_703259 [Exidia glandulosa HHB12029]|uniref:Uncharacterized protein n=1 Tax=Exidia glandulosa HHB12029 TaxID=1314781 RepID=A0A165ZE17_EXIGL|nr:hypothetical protein EXIGLDRAFT_703259 [Exidia glandulosa HHB12029]
MSKKRANQPDPGVPALTTRAKARNGDTEAPINAQLIVCKATNGTRGKATASETKPATTKTKAIAKPATTKPATKTKAKPATGKPKTRKDSGAAVTDENEFVAPKKAQRQGSSGEGQDKPNNESDGITIAAKTTTAENANPAKAATNAAEPKKTPANKAVGAAGASPSADDDKTEAPPLDDAGKIDNDAAMDVDTSDKTTNGDTGDTGNKSTHTDDATMDVEAGDKSTDGDAGKTLADDDNSAKALKDLDFDLSFLEADVFAAALESDDESASVPGPLSAALQTIWDAFLNACAAFIVKFSGASRKTTTLLWEMVGEQFKLKRDPNLYNMWVKKWSLVNAKEQNETKAEYHRRYVDAYHEDVDDMTVEKKQDLRRELLAWLADYEKECAQEAEDRGDGFKGVLDAKRQCIRLIKELARKHNLAIWGMLIPLRPGDAKMVASGGVIASHEELITLLVELGVNPEDLAGDIASCFGAKRVANRLHGVYTDEALHEVLNKSLLERRNYLRRALLEILNRVLKVPTDTLKWKGNASSCVERGFWCKHWPAGVLTPDEMGDNKYPESQHNTLTDAAYKTLRNEPNFPHIEFVRFTPEQLDWRRKDWKRWCALPVYRDSDGKNLILVGDVMPDEEEDIKKKGRASRVRFVARGVAPERVDDENQDGTPQPDPDLTAMLASATATTGNSKKPNNQAPQQKAEVQTTSVKRPRRSTEDYTQLMVGGGSDEYWQLEKEPVLKRRATRPDYDEDFETMEVDAQQNDTPSPASDGAITMATIQAKLEAAQQRQFMQTQKMLASTLQQFLTPSIQQQAGMNANWSQQQLVQAQQLQQQQLQQQVLQQQLLQQQFQQSQLQPPAQQDQQQQLPPFPSLDNWIPDGRGGFMPVNGGAHDA